MLHKTNKKVFLVLLMAIFFIACSNEKKTDEPEKTNTDDAKTKIAYDAALDPIKVEGNVISRVLGDTLGVKFYELMIKPGDSVGLHAHPDHIVYVVDGGMVELKDKEGKATPTDFKTGMGVVLGPDTHSGKNTGSTTIKMVVADIYRPRN